MHHLPVQFCVVHLSDPSEHTLKFRMIKLIPGGPKKLTILFDRGRSNLIFLIFKFDLIVIELWPLKVEKDFSK